MKKLEQLSLEEFEKYEGTDFSMWITEELEIKLILIEVKGLTSNREDIRQPFSLIFEADQFNEYYEQGVFRITHSEMQTLDLFLVPIGPGGKNRGMRYEAIFN